MSSTPAAALAETDREAARHSGRIGLISAAATLVVLLPLLVAVTSGVLGYVELRDALTYDARGFNAIAVHTKSMRLAQDTEADVRSYAATHRGSDLAGYRRDQAQLEASLRELASTATDLDVPGGGRMVGALTALHDRWRATVAEPLTSRQLKPAQRAAALERDSRLITAYREQNRRLSEAVHRSIVHNRNSSSGPLSRIALLFLASIATCALGVYLGARLLMRLDRERERAEATLHERELLHTRDRGWARSFQRAVLPPGLPAVIGCRFDAVYEPGESDSHVGGDWYDAVKLIDNRILISIGDVAGSGVEAAVVMGVARQIMRGIAQVHADPALMLDAADRALRIEHGNVFVTAWVGVIDLVTRTLTYSSAGHPPALLIAPDGTLAELRDDALPLGLRQGHQGSSTTIPLPDCSLLTLYTDGLTEATRDVIAGEERVRAAAAEIARRPWTAPAREIVDRVLTDGSLDDVAVLVTQVDYDGVERYIRRTRFDARDRYAARAARDVFLRVLTEREFRPLESLNAELVFGEIVGNVVRHTGGCSDVDIAIDCSGSQTVLHVFDRGPGFRHTSRLPSDLYAESGRGLFIIASVAEEFRVTERPDGGSHARATLIGGSARPLPSANAATSATQARAPAAEAAALTS